MKTIKQVSVAAFLAAASLCFSSSAWSLGLGDVTVESFLNQPLQVRIDLITRETDDATAIRAQLASANDYELIGASRDAIPVPIRFTVEDPEGEPYLLGTSNLPISNPVVRLIVEVNYASGRLLREYTVFLDPPTYAEQAPIPRVNKRKNPPVSAPAPTPAPEESESSTAGQEETPASQPADSTPSRSEPSEGEYGPVSSGETLWGISKNWSRGSGMDINKVMIAIQRENPEAFLRENINLLKRGAILRMPRAEDVRNISMASAISEVSTQTEQFYDRKARETVASTSTPLLAEETDSFAEAEASPPDAESVEDELAAEQAVAEVTADVMETAAVETDMETEPGLVTDQESLVQDQLELVPPSEASDLDSTYGFEESENEITDASVNTSSLRENLARTEEELITQQQQNDYLADRIKELEGQLADSEQGNAEDADLANMEERLRQQRMEQAASQQAAEPWYKKFSAWLIGLLVLAAAAGGWFLSRRGGAEEFVTAQPSEEEQLKDIKDEAEEVLRVLDDSDSAHEEADGPAEESIEEPIEEPEAKTFETSGDDAEVLDEESSDPEIQLDLARAYISMGDKEAARVILEEVSNNGNEAQRDEAKKMLDLLVS